MPSEAFLIEALCVDPLENHYRDALTYKVIGVTLSRERAELAVKARGVHPGCAWPHIEPGTPRTRITTIPVIEDYPVSVKFDLDPPHAWIKQFAIYGINVQQHAPVECRFWMRIGDEWRQYTGTMQPDASLKEVHK